MNYELNRRTFLKRVGQAGGLVVAGGTLESFLAACGGNVSTGGGTTPTPGVTPIGNAGLKLFQNRPQRCDLSLNGIGLCGHGHVL